MSAKSLLDAKIYTEVQGVFWTIARKGSNVKTRKDGVTLLKEVSDKFGLTLRSKVDTLMKVVSKQYAVEIRKAIQTVIREQTFRGASVPYADEKAAAKRTKKGTLLSPKAAYADRKMAAVGHLKKLLFTEKFVKNVKVFDQGNGNFTVKWVGRASMPFASQITTSRTGKRTGQGSLPITNAALASLFEEGTKFMKARPFLADALELAKTNIDAWKKSKDLKGILLRGSFGSVEGADSGFDRSDMEN